MIHWLEKHMATCSIKSHTGIDCPGCGMQRSIIELLKGNIWESIQLYPALLPLAFMFTFLTLHLIFNFKNGAKILKISYIVIAAIVLISYFIKIFTHYKLVF